MESASFLSPHFRALYTVFCTRPLCATLTMARRNRARLCEDDATNLPRERDARVKFRKCRDRLERMTKRGEREQIFGGSINGRHLRSLILIFVLTTREEKRGINLETRVGWLSPQRLLSTAIWKGFDEWRWSNFEIPLWLITTANQYFNYHVQFSMQNVIEDN